MEDIEIPEYFICPISLQIMRDPVTTITGITYDRQSIEKWLSGSNNKSKNRSQDNSVTYCPVTKQPLPRDSDLTPNHTLRRLIQSWCTENETRGIDRIPTPKAPLDRSNVMKMIKDLWKFDLQMEMVRKFEVLALENERNRKVMAEAGVLRAMLLFIAKFCYGVRKIEGLEESLRVLHLIGAPSDEARKILMENEQILESLTWVLGIESETRIIKAYTITLLKILTENASSHVVERLKPEVFKGIVWFLKDVNSLNSNPRRHVLLKENNLVKQAVNAALMILLETSSWSRNRVSMVESDAVFELIELELNSPIEKRTTELVLGVLSHLSSCAGGRAQILEHRGGVAMVTKRILRVSPVADDRALTVLSLVSKFSPRNTVVKEMVSVGTVAKLCMLLQVDCAVNLKERAKEILRAHFDEWKGSPCVDAALLVRSTS